MFTIQQVAKMLNDALEEKLSTGKCLICDEAASPQCRGLCKSHYGQFATVKYSIRLSSERATKVARKKFDNAQVAANKILPARRGRRAVKPNPFKVAS